MNKRNNLLLIDPNFDPHQAESCLLLIKADADSFSYAIINQATQQVMALFDAQECDGVQSLATYLKTDNYLSLPYKQIKIACYTENNVAIPTALYAENEVDLATNFFIAPATKNLHTQKQAFFDLVNVFSLTKTADDTITNYFADGQNYLHNAGLLQIAETVPNTALLLDFSANGFKVVYVANKKLIFQQSYAISNSEEFNYFLLLILNELAIDAETTNLWLCGLINTEDENYLCLLKYFTNITFLALEKDFNLTVLDDFPLHYYSSLLALSLCE